LKRSKRWALLLVALSAAGCRSNAGLPAPQLSTIEPSTGAAGVAVTIVGANFYAQVQEDLGQNAPVIDDTFQAWLGDTELGSVTRVDSTHLTAIVPADMKVKTDPYDLTVAGPYGEASLARAFTLLPP
jgi:IPT/TIG domain